MESESSKGPSNLYGNSQGKPTDNINFKYAVKFNQNTLIKHFTDHGEEVGAESAVDYEELAIEFANDVNNITHDSFVDDKGSTYKFSYETNEFVIVRQDGTVITYFIPERGEVYWNAQKNKHRL